MGHFPFITYSLIISLTLLVLAITRKDLASYGISLRNFRYHLDITVTAFLPIAIGFLPMAFGVNYTHVWGSLIMTVVTLFQLFLLGWMLKRKPTRNESGMVLGAFMLVTFSNLTQKAPLENPLTGFIFYLFFLGLGEEILFRGYIQSRLNEAFGRPYQFFGVSWGWGLVIASVIFGFMHIINIGSLTIAGNWQLEPWWGLWTFVAGLVHGFIREKTGSIVAPTILHGLPQALVTLFGF
ncbi:MAG: CPBP family intramembrane metalloprotease [Anaerolineae bacterium]|nr:CPBP family intramembrane metalloprotease [Anaerolineae bacterium]